MAHLTRRDFVKSVSAGVATAALGAESVLAQRGTGKNIPVIDTHQHLWDLSKFNLPWLSGASKTIKRSFLPADYAKATAGVNIAKTVYMEVDVHPDQHVKEAEYVIGLCRDANNPMEGAVIGCRPHTKEFVGMAKRFAKEKEIKGFRMVMNPPKWEKGFCLGPQFVSNMKTLGKLGLRYDICMRAAEIADGARLATQCPGTTFIVDHCGNMSVQSTDAKERKSWMAGMKAMAECENSYCKISGIVASAAEDWKPADLADNINFCLETFGEDRVCFAGDWPVCKLRATWMQWHDALREIVKDRSLTFQRKLFHDNAIKIYGLG